MKKSLALCVFAAANISNAGAAYAEMMFMAGATDMSGASINNATITNSSMSGGSASGVSITGGTMAGTAITGGSTSATNINGGTITGALFSGGSISGANISGGTISSVSFSGVTLTSAAVDNPTITNGTMSGTAISNAPISGSAISGGSITSAALSSVTVSGSSISGGSINNTAIGQTTPAAGSFTSLSAASLSLNGSPLLPVLSGTSGSIGGGLLVAGACSQGSVTISGASVGMAVVATPNTYPGDASAWKAYVSAANTVIVKVCALIAVTPSASTYNVRVIQ